MADVDNTEVAKQLAALYEKILALNEKQNDTLKDQVSIMKSIADAAGKKPAGGFAGYISETAQYIKELGIETDSTGQKVEKTFKEGLASSKKMYTSVSSVSEASGIFKDQVAELIKKTFTLDNVWKAITDTFGSFVSVTETVIGFFGQVATSIFSIGEAIFSIPMRIFSGMIKLAGALAEAYKHIAVAFEKFRGEFGAVYNLQGKALREGLAGAKSMNKLAGLGYFSVFQDSAEAIAFFQDSFTKMGPLVDSFAKEIGAMGGKFVHFVKGMGLSGEQVKTLSMIAKGAGKTLESTLSEVANMTLQMAESFGISNKQLAQDVTEMMGDVKTFGNTSVKSLTATDVRIRSLGIDIKALAGIVDKFLNFEDAAKSASMLSQSFGVNLDALGLMNDAGKDQGKLLDDLRNSMFAAGRDANKMSTAELRLLAQTTGLSEQEAKLAFSMENRGKSLEDIKKQSDKAKNSELTQAQAMGKLADAIERVIRVFQYDSFFGAFIQGFTLGVKHAAPFMKTLFSLQGALDETRIAGQAVGQAFIKTFPGVMDMLTALSDTFNPTLFSDFRKKIVDAFEGLFKDLDLLDPTASMTKFWLKLWGSFDVVTKSKTGRMYPAMQKAMMKMLKAFGKIISGSIPLLKDTLIKALNFISGGIKTGFDKQIKKLTGGSSFVTDLWVSFFEPIWEALKTAWADPKFKTALGIFTNTAMVALSDGLEKALRGLIDWVSAHPKITLGILSAIGGILISAAAITLVGGFIAGMGAIIGGALGALGTALSPYILGASAFIVLMGTVFLATFASITLGAWGLYNNVSDMMNNLKTALTIGSTVIKSKLTGILPEITTSINAIASGIITGLANGLLPVGPTMLKAFADGLSSVKTLLGIHSPSKVFSEEVGGPIAKGLLSGLTAGLDILPDTLMKSMGGTDIVDSIVGDAQATLQTVIAKISAINGMIADIPELDIQMKLEKIGKVLGIKNNTMQIDAKPVNITLNLSVTLEADKLATVLLETKKIMPQGG